MAIITCSLLVDTREVAKRLKAWLDGKDFETRAFQSSTGYTLKARKSSGLRSAVGADRALEIGIRHQGEETQVEVRQGSWKTNAVSNAAWMIATGGANIAVSGWSLMIQKELEQFVRTVFDDLTGSREVDLSEPVQPLGNDRAHRDIAAGQTSFRPANPNASRSMADLQASSRSTAKEEKKSPPSRKIYWLGALFFFVIGPAIIQLVDKSVANSNPTAKSLTPIDPADVPFGCVARRNQSGKPGKCDLAELCRDEKELQARFERAKLGDDREKILKAAQNLHDTMFAIAMNEPAVVTAVCKAALAPPTLQNGTAAPSSSKSSESLAAQECRLPPLAIFVIGRVYTTTEINQQIADKCPSGARNPDGNIVVRWDGSEWLVTTSARTEPNGLSIQEVMSVRKL